MKAPSFIQAGKFSYAILERFVYHLVNACQNVSNLYVFLLNILLFFVDLILCGVA